MTRYTLIFFFFFKQKTAYEIKECDWSSDVCSPISGKQSQKLTKEGYQKYLKNPNIKNKVSYSEYSKQVQPKIEEGIKTNALISGVTTLAILGGVKTFKAIKDLRELKKFKYETEDYEKAKAFLKKQNELAHYLPQKEYPAREISLERSDLQKLNKIGISQEDLKGNIRVSTSTQEIKIQSPEMVKIDVPEKSPLFKKTNAIYQVRSKGIKTLFRNTIKLALKDKNGNIKIYTKSFITKKPLTSFRNPESAFKYSINKRILLSEVKPQSNLVRTKSFKLRGGKLSNQIDYLTSVKRIGEPTIISTREGKLNLFKTGENVNFYSAITKKVGKVEQLGLKNQELFSLSPKSSESIIQSIERNPTNDLIYNLDESLAYKEKISSLSHLTNTEPLSTDFSKAKKVIGEINKFKRNVIKKGMKLDLPVENSEFQKVNEVKSQFKDLKRLGRNILKKEKNLILKTKNIPEEVKVSSTRSITEKPILRNDLELKRPKLDLPNVEIPSFLSGIQSVKQGIMNKISSSQISSQQLKSIQKNKQANLPLYKNVQKTIPAQAQVQKLKTITTQTNVNTFANDFVNPLITEPVFTNFPPRKPSKEKANLKIIPFGFGHKKRLASSKKKQQGYNVFVKPARSKKYAKVGNDLNLKNAESLRNYAIDNSTSRSGYIKPTKEKAKPMRYNIPSNYGTSTQNKFRTFKQRKGRRIPLPQRKVIEKNPYLIDTRGEKKELSVFKLLAKKEKKAKKVKNAWELA